jgi:hypothetical protein
MSTYKQSLLPDAKPIVVCKFPNMGPELKSNKAKLIQAGIHRHISEERRVLFLVMAMMETDHLAERERDKRKDKCIDGTANASIFNVNQSMLRALGYLDNIRKLDSHSRLGDVMALLNKGINHLGGVSSLLDYHRGGETTFKDHTSYLAAEYRNGVASALAAIDANNDLITNEFRIWMDIPYVNNKVPCKER